MRKIFNIRFIFLVIIMNFVQQNFIICIDNNKANKFIYLTYLYNETNEKRIKEFIYCLEKNLTHNLIESCHIIYDTSNDSNSKKSEMLTFIKSKNVKITYIKGRPTYGFFFNLVNELYPNKNIILANGDIFFNETLNILEYYDLTDKFLALTRWNIDKNGKINPFLLNGKPLTSSQDVWIFQSPIRKFEKDDIELGTLGCDRRIAFWAARSGFSVLNPCKSIQCIHLHLSGIRHYPKQYPPQEFSMCTPWSTLQ